MELGFDKYRDNDIDRDRDTGIAVKEHTLGFDLLLSLALTRTGTISS